MTDEPNPGSDEARAKGCRCPILDNGHGRGSGRTGDDGKPLFWVNVECPLHGPGFLELHEAVKGAG